MALAVLSALCGLAMTGAAWAAPAAQPVERGPEIIKLTLYPVPTTRPALMYHLLPDLTEQTPGDAAQLYQLACSLMNDKLQEKYFDELDQGLTIPLDHLSDQGAIQDVDLDSSSVRYAHLAARSEDVKWDFAFRQEGINALLPHLNYMRELSMYIELKARVNIARHDWPGAVDALQDGFSMSRQLGEGGPALVQAFVAGGIESEMLHEVGEWISQPGAPNLYWALSDLPQPCLDLRQCMQTEQAMLAFTFPHLAEAEKGEASPQQVRDILEGAVRFLHQQDGSPEPPKTPLEIRFETAMLVASQYSDAKKQLIQSGLSKEKVDAMSPGQAVALFFLQQYRAFADEVYKGWELPYWQAGRTMHGIWQDAQEEMHEAKEKTGNPFLSFIPSLNNARTFFLPVDRKIAILRTIEMLRDYASSHDGRPPASLNQITGIPIPIDPATGKIFSYELKGRTAILDAPGLEGEPRSAGEQYELTFEK